MKREVPKARLVFRKMRALGGTPFDAKNESKFLLQMIFNSMLPFIGGVAFASHGGNASIFAAGVFLLAIPILFQMSITEERVVEPRVDVDVEEVVYGS